MLSSYPSIFTLGHRAVKDLFNTEVLIEEKVDGSQFSFGIHQGEMRIKSKGAVIYPPVTDKLFKDAAEYVNSIKDLLIDGWTYRGEVLARVRHNTLEYARTPKHNIIIFDIERGNQDFLAPYEKVAEAARLDLEVVPVFFQGKVENIEQLKELFEKDSCLGKAKIEGMVIKNYAMFGLDKKVLMGKWVSEAFKEVHHAEWKSANPNKSDFLTVLIKGLKTEARWNKAIQHLREAGQLTDSPADIGALLKEVQADTRKEMEDELKQRIFDYMWPQIARGIIGGFPEYYKTKLAESQFAPTVQ
jgi:hypothetical protein